MVTQTCENGTYLYLTKNNKEYQIIDNDVMMMICH